MYRIRSRDSLLELVSSISLQLYKPFPDNPQRP
jgi:hypothetical protein